MRRSRRPLHGLFVLALALAAPTRAAEPAGAALFEQYCIPCHGPDGRARTPAARKLGAKDLTESRLPEAEVTRQISNGTKDASGKDRMPAFKPKLTDAAISALVAFVVGLRN